MALAYLADFLPRHFLVKYRDRSCLEAMCATWWKRIPERSVYERPSSVTIGKVCHRKVNVYTSLSAEENVFFVRSFVVVGGFERSSSHSFSSLSLSLSFHPMYRHIVRTLFNTHCFVNVSSIFVNREKERERNFSFDTSPWRSISPSTRLFSFHCSFILFALLSGPN